MLSNKQLCFLILSIALYMIGILLYALEPVIILYNWDLFIFNSNILCIIFTMGSFFLMTKSFQISRIRFLYVILFLMTYFALIVGNNDVFDYVLKKLFNYYEKRNMIESDQYEKLWTIWTNDLSRNLMYFLGFFYSFLTTLIYFIFGKIKGKVYNESMNIEMEDN